MFELVFACLQCRLNFMFYLYSDYRLVLKKIKRCKKNNYAKLFGGFALLYYYYILLILLGQDMQKFLL